MQFDDSLKTFDKPQEPAAIKPTEIEVAAAIGEVAASSVGQVGDSTAVLPPCWCGRTGKHRGIHRGQKIGPRKSRLAALKPGTRDCVRDVFEAIDADLAGEPPELAIALRILFAPLAEIRFDDSAQIADVVGCDVATVETIGARYRRAGYWGAAGTLEIPLPDGDVRGISVVLLALVGTGKIEASPDQIGLFRAASR